MRVANGNGGVVWCVPNRSDCINREDTLWAWGFYKCPSWETYNICAAKVCKWNPPSALALSRASDADAPHAVYSQSLGELMESLWLIVGLVAVIGVLLLVVALLSAIQVNRRRQEASDGGSVAGGGDYTVREDAPAESQGGGSWWDAISDWFSSGDAGDAGGADGGGDGGGGGGD